MAEAGQIPDQFSEVYELQRTVDLVWQLGFFRIEIIRTVRGGQSDAFAARYYEQVDGVWRVLSGPAWVSKLDIDGATDQAIFWLAAFLRERDES